MSTLPMLRTLTLATVASLVAGCSGNGNGSVTPGSTAGSAASSTRGTSAKARHATSPATGIIDHVVFIVQENRSFNFMFNGFPGALTQNYGYDENGNQITLHQQTIDTDWDIDHSANAFFDDYDNGKLDGWNTEEACCGQPVNFAYAYAIPTEVKTYWDMAKKYVLADNMFQSNIDGSFIAHQYAIAAYANGEVNFPSGDWGCEGGEDTIQTLTQNRTYGPTVNVCENYQTLGDELDAASVPWHFYTAVWNGDGGIWSAYGAIEHIYDGPDWTNDVINPAGQIISDAENGNLPAVSWVTPTYGDSDHGGMDSTGGPAWVSSIVNAVGESQYWKSTAIFLIWDDWGGFFDPVVPVYEDYDGLGFRIPLIVISPYAVPGSVTHTQYETASVLKFVEDDFGLGPLAASDARANDPATDSTVFDFSHKPRKFKPFKAQFAHTKGHASFVDVGGD